VARSVIVARMLRSRVMRIARSVLVNLVSMYRKPLSFGRRVRSASLFSLVDVYDDVGFSFKSPYGNAQFEDRGEDSNVIFGTWCFY
jgi:hypothetical protein